MKHNQVGLWYWFKNIIIQISLYFTDTYSKICCTVINNDKNDDSNIGNNNDINNNNNDNTMMMITITTTNTTTIMLLISVPPPTHTHTRKYYELWVSRYRSLDMSILCDDDHTPTTCTITPTSQVKWDSRSSMLSSISSRCDT